jgi:K+-sensing histidine kinase KdpD
MVALSVVALIASGHHLRPHADSEGVPAPPAAVPEGAVLVAVDAGPDSAAVVETAARVARSRGAGAHVVHVRETRVVEDGAADLETPAAAHAIVDRAVERLRAAGVSSATGETIHVTGHHAAAGEAILALADRTLPSVLVVGRAGAHGGEVGAPSVTAVLTERAPCDVVVVAGERRAAPVGS